MILSKCAYYGFDKMDGSDDREEEWAEQRAKRGFDDSELWSLGDTIVKFSIPRIKRFMEIESVRDPEWDRIKGEYEALIEGLELFIKDEGLRIWNAEEKIKVEKALKDFGGFLPPMWN